ncbi:hypothetical protein M1590_04470 [Candidatus Marsarchaeota archaeon]|nr:hypothetical protein [Candidatus Marsarchaeota archaeon]
MRLNLCAQLRVWLIKDLAGEYATNNRIRNRKGPLGESGPHSSTVEVI